ncbi:DUF4352 domain-containing protein [Microbacterium tumbae]
MFSVFTRRGIGARSKAVALVAPVLALSVALAGCTVASAGDETDDGESATDPVTTSWVAPDDPTAEGPTEAPALPEEHGALDETITLSTGMAVAVDSIETTTVTPETPGEYAGSAVIVRVSVKNGSDAAQNIDSAVVMVVTDDGETGVATTAGPNRPLQGDVAPGASVEGSYVFMLDPAQGRAVTVSVNYAAGEPVALFSGTVA